MDPKRTCMNCVKGTKININSDILCRINGVVSSDYVCANHRFMPAEKTFKELNYKCIDCEYFAEVIRSQRNSCIMGVCQLFSVRNFDGTKRSACSKFAKRQKYEVS